MSTFLSLVQHTLSSPLAFPGKLPGRASKDSSPLMPRSLQLGLILPFLHPLFLPLLPITCLLLLGLLHVPLTGHNAKTEIDIWSCFFCVFLCTELPRSLPWVLKLGFFMLIDVFLTNVNNTPNRNSLLFHFHYWKRKLFPLHPKQRPLIAVRSCIPTLAFLHIEKE